MSWLGDAWDWGSGALSDAYDWTKDALGDAGDILGSVGDIVGSVEDIFGGDRSSSDVGSSDWFWHGSDSTHSSGDSVSDQITNTVARVPGWVWLVGVGVVVLVVVKPGR